jgi:glycosyltransferase involved in cell wall biosynthesis
VKVASPVVSVIVPCYNSAATVGDTIRSIQSQTYGDWEAIVLDDGSSDTTAEIMKKWSARDSRIRFHAHDNRGLSATRNRGIEFSQGRWLVFLDSDDLLSPNYLESQLLLCQANLDAVVYSHNTYFFDNDMGKRFAGKDGSQKEWMPQVSGSGEEVGAWLSEANIMVVSAAMVPCALAVEIDGFDESLTSLEDWDFWIRCLRCGRPFIYNQDRKAETWIRLRHDSMSMDGQRMFLNEAVVRHKHREWPAMRKAIRRKQLFYLKAVCKDLTELEFRNFGKLYTLLRI